MTDPKEDKAEGTADKMKGKAKEAGGALTDDKSMRAEGQKDQLKGEGKKKVGKAKEKLKE
ncbi:MAG: CsbD family protein [Rhodothermales bacterium]